MRTKKHIVEDMVFVNHLPDESSSSPTFSTPHRHLSIVIINSDGSTSPSSSISPRRSSRRSSFHLSSTRLLLAKSFLLLFCWVSLGLRSVTPGEVSGVGIESNSTVTPGPLSANVTPTDSIQTLNASAGSTSYPRRTSGSIISCRPGAPPCHFGRCDDGDCVCDAGWTGTGCEVCQGRGLLRGEGGVVTDGAGNYTMDTTCTWLVKVPENKRIRLNFDHFATECSWDHLYVYDGDSAFAPLLGIFSGLITPAVNPDRGYAPEIVSSNNTLYLHFYSDAAYNMTGFSLNFTAEDCEDGSCCPRNCSGSGVCSASGSCRCDDGLIGDSCSIPSCSQAKSGPTSPPPLDNEAFLHSFANADCGCNVTHRGPQCRAPRGEGLWQVLEPEWDARPLPALASFAPVLDETESILYVVGGTSFVRNEQHPFLSAFHLKNGEPSTWRLKGKNLTASSAPSPRYGHTANLYKSRVIVFGGVINGSVITNQLWEFNLKDSSWSSLSPVANATPSAAKLAPPLAVTGHASVVVGDRLVVIFGHSPMYGYVNHVQELDLESKTWSLPKVQGAVVKGGYGHTATYLAAKRLIFVHGGLVSEKQTASHLVDSLYEFDPFKRFWRILRPSGQPKYLHSSVFINGLLLVFGGNTHKDTSMSFGAKCFSADFLAYDVDCGSWHRLPAPRSTMGHEVARFGHGAVAFGKGDEAKMLVFGGFNGFVLRDALLFSPAVCAGIASRSECLSSRAGIKCVWASDKFRCRSKAEAETLRADKQVPADLILSAVCDSNSVTPSGDSGDPTVEGDGARTRTTPPSIVERDCVFTDCASCTANAFNCSWCMDTCIGQAHHECAAVAKIVAKDGNATGSGNTARSSTNVCSGEKREATPFYCSTFHNCLACEAEEHCMWQHPTGTPKCVPLTNHQVKPLRKTDKDMKLSHYNPCDPPCSSKTSCQNCTGGMCMWCDNIRRCVDSNAYVVSFPFGQCMAWVNDKERCPVTKCADIKTCGACLEDPRCGWCDDGSRTGLGACMEGGDSGPVDVHHTAVRGLVPGVHMGQDPLSGQPPPVACDATRWHFTSCPQCQCHGHASCPVGTDRCGPCRDNTEGQHCETCKNGFWGKPKLGNNCTACDCNHQAVTCDRKDGRCNCKTKGIIGDKCESCDVSSQYVGNPIYGSCFYQLKPDYHYTFNLSKPDDNHYTQINFQNVPKKPRKDVEFTLNCSQDCKFNITFRSNLTNGERLITQGTCGPDLYEKKFKASQHHFGPPYNTTFYVYVYGFRGGNEAHPSFYVKISFQQSAMPFSLVNLFIIFFSCFLSLLVVGGIFWKVKQRYDNYRRRQRAYVEMEQMASRPFAMICPDLSPASKEAAPSPGANSAVVPPAVVTVQNGTRLSRPKGNPSSSSCPSPIALEPCADSKAAVLSLLVVLPCGDEESTPPGTTGLLIGSTLVNLGSHRKSSEPKLHREGWNPRKGGNHSVAKDAAACRNTNYPPTQQAQPPPPQPPPANEVDPAWAPLGV